MMKKILTLLIFLSLFGIQSPMLYGESSDTITLPESILDSIDGKGMDNTVQSATVYFTNEKTGIPQLCFDYNSTLEDLPFGVYDTGSRNATRSSSLYETVIRRDYTIQALQRTAFLVGPRVDSQFYLSVAKGQTITTTHRDRLEGKLILPSNIDNPLQLLLNKKFQADHDGNLVYEWSGQQTYNGPEEESSYNSRFHYHALDYDQYSIVVETTSYINVYANGHYLYQKILRETIPEFNVNAPIFISYHQDLLIE